MKKILEKYGYKKEGYGYVKTVESEGCLVYHWVTLFGSDSFQMYSYVEGMEDEGYSYTTGVLKDVTEMDLEYLIDLFVERN